MDISQLLGSSLGQQVISEITKNSEASEEETSSVINAAAPVLMGMLHKNASTGEGASNLLNALKSHSGGILDNLTGALSSPETSKDGEGILGHILGGQRGTVEKQISQKTGVDLGKVAAILPLLAPIILGHLGSKTRSGNVSGSGSLTDLLGGIMGNMDMSSAGGNILGSILGGGRQKSGGLGGLLGGLFGKK